MGPGNASDCMSPGQTMPRPFAGRAMPSLPIVHGGRDGGTAHLTCSPGSKPAGGETIGVDLPRGRQAGQATGNGLPRPAARPLAGTRTD